jgi:alkanesulfonate monooxygenase SsuD/methylene tetrahydromethanopterin reductase-like flavin-dependent oxidoreductase (luciferase family)
MQLGYLVSPEYTPGTDMSAALRDQRSVVRACRELGMDSIFVAEHLSRGESVWFPPLMLLSHLCQFGEGMTFGTAVLAAGLHNPVHLAEQAGFLDAATGGKFVLGLASGWNRSEFESVGADMKTRGKALDETMEILRLLWGSQEPVTYHGEVYSFRDTLLSLRPQAGAAQPIWLGASSDRALRRAARAADAWMISSHMSTEHAAAQMETYRQLLAEAGRPYPAVRPALKSIYVAPTMEAAKLTGGDQLTASYEMFKNWGLFTDVFQQRVDTVGYSHVTERASIGDPQTVAEQITDFVRRTDVNYLLVRSQWIGIATSSIIKSLELLCGEVMPLVEAELGSGSAVTPPRPGTAWA